jgi:hypothetical protein
VKPPQRDRRRSDPAARLAYFLYDYQAPEGLGREERRERLDAAIVRHFPDISDEERIRGYEIATELMRADAMEMDAATAKLTAELRRRKAAARRAERSRRRPKPGSSGSDRKE